MTPANAAKHSTDRLGRSCFKGTVVALFVACAFMLPAIPTQAATLNVTTTAMTVAADGQCSLVEAMQAARTSAAVNECPAGSSPNIINLQAGATYTATTVGNSDGTFGDSAVLSGNAIEINGNGATLTQTAQMRLFLVTSGSLTLRNLTISGGSVTNGAQAYKGWGGAILAAFSGVVNLEDVTIAANSAAAEGAALLVTAGATANVHRSTIANNVSSNPGACQIRIDQTGRVNIANSTMDGAQRLLCVSGASFLSASNTTLQSSQVIEADGTNTIAFQNSILSGICNVAAAFTSTNNSGGLAGCNEVRTLPALLNLGARGGATQTLLPRLPNTSKDAAPGCSYLSSGTNPLFANGAAITTDQRGFARDASCDVGAVESMTIAPATLPNGTFNAPYSATITQTGGADPANYSSLSLLPSGLSLSSAGTLSGTPTQAGSYAFVVQVTDANGIADAMQYQISIAKINQTITFSAQGGQTYSPGGTFTINPVATSSSGLAVAHSSGSTGICTVSGTTVTILSAGTCILRATQSGNVNYNAATLTTQNVVIAPASQTIAFGAQAGQTFAPGGTFAISPAATATSSLAVTYSSLTAGVCTVSGGTVTMVAAGTCTIAADQAGNGNYNAAPQATQGVMIAPGSQTITFGVLPNLAIGSAPFTVAATSSSALAVSFTSQTTGVCTATGTNGSTITLLSLGTCTLRASQAGNANFAAATPVDRSFSVTQSSTTFTLTSSANPVTYGAPVTLTAQIKGANPGGTVTFSVSGAGGFAVVCNAVPVSAGAASCVAPGSLHKSTPVSYIASYSGDINNVAASASLQQQVRIDSVSLSAIAQPTQTAAGRPVTLRALVTAKTFTNTITFYENGVPLSGCANVAITLLPGSTDTGVATCTIAAISAGSHNYVVTYPLASGPAFEQTYLLNVVAQASAPLDYTDMWWAGATENGWGVSITQHGMTQFIVLYVYDAAGKPVWYVMPGGSWNAGQNAYSGALYLPTSSSFSAYDASAFKANASVGTATVTYASASTATLTYTINGVSGSKNIQRQVFATDDGQPKLQVGDLWWGGSEQNGWGVNIAQQGRTLFPVWYTYDANGKDVWYAMPGGTWSGTTYSGDLYAITSSAWLGATYNPASFAPVKVGTMSLSFIDQNTATMTYTVNNVTQTKAIVRQPF
ncbi:MAG: Ig-like domain repeat protein [Betaproteobacteria bacterium]|nr:Ig-like domain repeat protein [Betaproteobacteria bacterium]